MTCCFHDQLAYGDVNFAKEDRLNDQDGFDGQEDSSCKS